MKYRATIKMDLSVVDEQYEFLRIKKGKPSPIGDVFEVEGTAEDIKKNLINRIENASENLKKIYYGEE